jgi:hypothetical protein
LDEIIILCVAPTEVQYVLDLYERNVDKYPISIYVINTYNNYQFLKSLDLKLKKLEYLCNSPTFRKSSLVKIVKEYFHLKYIFRNHFSHYEKCEVYYFNHYTSWLSFSIVGRLSRYNKCIFYDHFDVSLSGKSVNLTQLKWKIKLSVYKIVSGIELGWSKVGEHIMLEFQYEKYQIWKQPAPVPHTDLYKKYSCKIKDVLPNTILLFETAENYEVNFKSYRHDLTQILSYLIERGFKIHLKPHPRLESSGFLYPFIQQQLPSFIPGEFLSLSNYICVMGVSTRALANTSLSIASISLLEIFEYTTEEQKSFLRKYLNEQSNNRILFPKSLTEIDELIKTK